MFIDPAASQNLARSCLVFFTYVSNCLCLLIFGNQLSAVYFGADGMSFVACGVVVTGHSTVPLEGCLSSLCSFPGFAEVNGGILFCLKFMVLLASWHAGVLLGIHLASKPDRSRFPYHVYTKSTVNCTSIFMSYNLMQDKFVEINTQSVRHCLDFHLTYFWMWQLHSPPNHLCWKWTDTSDPFSGNFEWIHFVWTFSSSESINRFFQQI